MRPGRSLRFRSQIVTTMVALLMVGLMAPAADAAKGTPKPFTMTVSPSVATAGASAQFTATFTNQSQAQLGSANLSVPAAFSISGVLTSQGSATFVGQTVNLRSLALAPQRSLTVDVTATAACSSSANNVWSAVARTGANFTGLSFQLVTPKGDRTTAVTGACSLAFVAGRQPADAVTNAIISSSPADPDGPPVQVGVLDGAHNLRTGGSPISISMAIGTNPGGGILAGTKTVPTAAGIATFSDLSIDQPGDGYTLVATGSGLASSATSDPFEIAELVMTCEPNVDCTGSLTQDDTGATVNALADPSSPVLTMSLTPGGIDCTGYGEQSSTLTFNVTTDRTKEVTMSFDTGLDPNLVHPGDFQVCFESETPFLDRGGAMVTLGLLPDCDHSLSHPPVPPCVKSRSSIGSVVSLTFLAPAGDPRGRV
jgi:hypothetical protein